MEPVGLSDYCVFFFFLIVLARLPASASGYHSSMGTSWWGASPCIWKKELDRPVTSSMQSERIYKKVYALKGGCGLERGKDLNSPS